MADLTVKEAEKLAKKYLRKYPEKIAHSIKVSEFAYKIAKKIKKKHPELDINLREIRILGLLHDIGKGMHVEWIYHSFEGGKLLRRLGYHKYASKIEKHDPTHEVAKYLKIKGDFIPKQIEEKILVYADSHYRLDRFVHPSERVSEGEKKIKKRYPALFPVIKGYRKRQIRIIEEINSLIR